MLFILLDICLKEIPAINIKNKIYNIPTNIFKKLPPKKLDTSKISEELNGLNNLFIIIQKNIVKILT